MTIRTAALFVVAAASLFLRADCVRAQAAQPVQTVQLTMIVTDSAKHSVDDVRQEEIEVVEDKLPIPISSFVKDKRPVDYGLVIDTTGSFRTLLNSVVQSAKVLVDGNRPEDETFVERFVNSDHIERVAEFTGDKARLGGALDSLYVRGGQSAVIDAVYIAVKHTAENRGGIPERRRAVVLFTDGEDRASFYDEDKLVKLLRESDVQVFIVGITGELDKQASPLRASPREKAEHLLKTIAEESGGRVFFPRGAKETAEALEQITHDLHSQYLISYERPLSPEEKGFRKFKVKLTEASGHKKFTVITRSGYLVNVTGQKPDNKKSP